MKRSPERVLFLPKWYPNPEDPQLGVFIREHAEALSDKLGVGLLYAHPDPKERGGYRIELDRSRGFTELIVYYGTKGVPSFMRFLRYFKALRKGWKRYLLEEGRPDLLHAHMLNRPALFAYMLRLRTGTPFLVSEQWSGFMDGKAEQRPFLKRWGTRFLLKRADGVSAVSNGLAEALEERGAPHTPWVIPNTVVDPGPPFPIPRDPVRFFNISDMVDRLKNLSGLLRAFKSLCEEREEELELHLVGGGPDEERVRRYAEELGLDAGQVRFYGRLPNEEVHALFPRMSALVVNSYHETFSVVTVESLAHGRPVAASKCGGPEGILRGEEYGVLFPKGDDEATKEAMARILDRLEDLDPERLHRYAIEEFGKERLRERYLAFYQEAMP